MTRYKNPALITIIIVGFFIASCGPASKLRRAEKLIGKAEQQGAVWRVDTVIQKIPVPYPEIQVKEVHHALPGDTVVIEKERLKVKVLRLPGDTIEVEAKCESDTILVEVPTVVTKTIEAKSGIPWWWLVIAGLVGAGAIALFKRS